MTELGYVLKCKGNYAQIRIERNSACGSCGKCGMTESQKHMDFYVENTLNAQLNDYVEIDIPDANTAKMAFVGYILPIIPALILLFVSIGMKWKEWLSVLLFFVGLALGYAIVALIDKLRKRKWAASPKMIKIIKLTKSEKIIEGEQNNE